MNNRPKIIELSTELTNMIAAGEVIERPASIVKELVENSIDADATTIRIDLVSAGIDKITIIDNGIGMNAEDISLAIKPHATSKIKSFNDLFAIRTLGFRGEALPSIASISHIEITSSINGYEGYTKVYEFNRLLEEKLTSFPRGTKIEVSKIFHNTPARLKHLSSEQVELSHTMQLITKLSLAYPQIAFILTNNGKVFFATDGSNDFDLIIKEIYGSEIAKSMIAFEEKSSLYQIKGYTSNISVFRSNKNAINLIINHRIIKNQNLIYAIIDAYKSYLPIGKYPIVVLEIIANPSYVDVNVHPTKLEVRFTDERELRNLITETIKNVLRNTQLIYEVNLDEVATSIPSIKNNFEKEEDRPLNKPAKTLMNWDDFPSSVAVELKTDIKPDDKVTINDDDIFTYQEKNINTSVFIKEEIKQPKMNFENDEKNNFFQSLEYIGQYDLTYLIFQKDSNLYLIDQHAAMERIMYEKISSSFTTQTSEFYELLVPLTINLPIFEINLLENKKIELAKMHIEYELFDKNTVIIRKVPLWIPANHEREFISDIFNYLLQNKSVDRSLMYDEIAKLLSCKKSIKANMLIHIDEVRQLLNDLDHCQNPYTCPHGRPTVIHFSQYEIEKLFKRVGN